MEIFLQPQSLYSSAILSMDSQEGSVYGTDLGLGLRWNISLALSYTHRSWTQRKQCLPKITQLVHDRVKMKEGNNPEISHLMVRVSG